MKELLNKSTVVPGGFLYYKDPDSGLVFQHPFFDQLNVIAKAHRSANNYPVGAGWDEYFEDNVCENSKTAPCAKKGLDKKAIEFAKSMARWVKAGLELVSEEVLAQRESICSKCEFFSGKKSFFKVGCRKCGCSGKKLHLATVNCPILKW